MSVFSFKVLVFCDLRMKGTVGVCIYRNSGLV